jgi:hypothetical protein
MFSDYQEVYTYSAIRRKRDTERERERERERVIAVSRLVSVSEEVFALFPKYAM